MVRGTGREDERERYQEQSRKGESFSRRHVKLFIAGFFFFLHKDLDKTSVEPKNAVLSSVTSTLRDDGLKRES